MKKRSIICAAIALLTALCLLSGCQSAPKKEAIASGNVNAQGYIVVANSPEDVKTAETKGALNAAAGFTFDFMTMEYGFDAVDNAEFYFIRVFPVVNGVESNSASFQSEKITAAGKGTIPNEILLAGDYNAHLVASAAGYTSSDVSVSGTSTLLAAPSLTANWEKTDDVVTGAKLTLTAGDELVKSFTLTVKDAAGSTVYENTDAAPGEVILTLEDFGKEALTVEDQYNVTLTVNPISGYTLPAEPSVSADITEARGWGFPGGGPGMPPPGF